MGTRSDADERLAAYLNEHLLGSEGGVEAFRAAGRTWAGTPHAAAIERLAADVARDRRDLARLVLSLGLRPARWKRLLTGALRAIGAAAPYNLLRRRRASTAQLELDVLMGAVRAKLAMWEVLHELARIDARIDALLAERLRERAERQLDELRRVSLATCAERFGPAASGEARA